MKKNCLITLVIVFILTITSMVYAADDNIKGFVDTPIDSQFHYINEDLKIAGWAVSANEDRISRIDILLNGQVLGSAVYGKQRDDVYKAYPQLKDSKTSGFEYSLSKSLLTLGEQKLSVQIVTATGTTKTLGVVNIYVVSLKTNMAIGTLDSPPDLKTAIKGNQDTVVSGWVIDQNGVAAVNIYLDDQLLGQANYNLPRGDVHKVYPKIKGADKCGFNYSLESKSIKSGAHILIIKEISINGTDRIIASRLIEKGISVVNIILYILLGSAMVALLVYLLKKR